MPKRTYDTSPTDQDIAEAREQLLARPAKVRMAYLAGYLGGALETLATPISDGCAARTISRARAMDLAYRQLVDEQANR